MLANIRTSPFSMPFPIGRFILLSLLLVLYAWGLIDTYDFQIAGGNPGMLPWEMTDIGLLCCVIGIGLVAWLLADAKGEPSDFFLTFYSSIVVISYLTLHSVLGGVKDEQLLIFLAIVVLPVVSVKICGALLPRFRCSGFVSPALIQNAVVIFVVASIAGGYLNSPSTVGFGIDDSHLRLLEGRDIYISGSVLAYALSMSMNGLVPYLAYRAGGKFNLPLFAIAASSAIFFYWLIGVKAPLFYVVIAFGLGLLVKTRRVKYFGALLLGLVVVLYGAVLIEWYFFADYSFIADYFFRRVFAVQAEVLSFYFDFLVREKPFDWSWWSGAADPSFQATYYIGKTYILNEDSNVNTNAFLYALAAAGFAGYLVAIAFVSLFLTILDRLYKSSRNPAYVFIGFMYGLLIVEQAFTVALASSGIAILFVLALMEKNEYSPTPSDAVR